MSLFDPIDTDTPEFIELHDELPLWSAPFGLWILDRAPIAPGLTILDLGSGTGFLAVELAERCGPSATVIAVDPWGAAMARLQRKVMQRRLTHVHLRVQDAATLELPERSVDLIVSNLGVNNFGDPDAVMAVCSRIAKPGATFLLTTNLVGHMAEFYEIYRRVLRQTGQGDRIAALQAHVNHRATEASIRNLLGRAGFEVTEVAHDTLRLRFADGSALLRHHLIRIGFLQAWKDIAAAGMADATFARLEAELDAVAAGPGGLCLTVPTAGFVATRAG